LCKRRDSRLAEILVGGSLAGDSRNMHHGAVELFDISLLAAPAGVVVALVASVWTRHLAPTGLTILGLVMGGMVGRLSREVFANPPQGFGFGSEFEGFEWVIGFASAGAFVGAVIGTWAAARRMRARPRDSSWASRFPG
jgi:hypothetical protein